MVTSTRASDGDGPLRLGPEIVAALEAQLPEVAERTVAAVSAEVPAYAQGRSRGRPWARGSSRLPTVR